MKLCRFNGGRLGMVVPERNTVVDVSLVYDKIAPRRYPFPREDLFIAALPDLLEPIREAAKWGEEFALCAVKLDSPVANPGKIIGAPVNYADHAVEGQKDPGIASGRQIPSIGDWGMFLKAGSSLVGFGGEISLRFADRRNDHELELGVVIANTCTQVSRSDAMKHVAGYCIALDMTLRGTEFQCFRKSIDSYSVLGPWLVTVDEIENPGALDLELKVNGMVRQKSNTRHLIYDVPRLIEFASSFYTLNAGDVIMTGTPAGVGPVKPGDRLDMCIEKVGSGTIWIAPQYANVDHATK